MGRKPEWTFFQKKKRKTTHTVNKYRKKVFKPLILREMQIKYYTELSPHSCEDGYYQKDKKKQVLVRLWRKGNPCALLVGM